ncbi:beta-lactamase family protein, partial [bacterium]|nr:beta-lactamase family protein [bacterium]
MNTHSIRKVGSCRTILLILIVLFLVGNAAEVAAQIIQPPPEDLTRLDQWYQAYLAENNIPGGLVAVASKGRILHLEPYGRANVELAVPVTDSTVFEIGSISKQFVSAAVMLLVQEKKIALDDPIHQYLPNLPNEWLGVTVYHLLTHTSGIPDYEEIRSYDVYRFRLTPEDVIHIAQSRPIDFAPGTGWYYSNTGYYLLSMIVAQIDGRPLGQVLESRIFGPLGMRHTRMANPEAIIPHRAAGYWVNKAGELINRNPTETSSTLGAGGILSSVHDLVKWDAALYTDQLLSNESKTTLWTQAILANGDSTGYALAWNVRPYQGHRKYSHVGQVAGFVAR